MHATALHRARSEALVGPRGSAAETAFCTTLTNKKVGDNALLPLIRPNLMTKPATVMFNKVDIKNGDQAGKMFGRAQQGIGKAVIDSVKSGIIPKDEAADILIFVGVFIHWEAKDDARIRDWNYQTTKIAIERAVKGAPSIDDVVSKEDVEIQEK